MSHDAAPVEVKVKSAGQTTTELKLRNSLLGALFGSLVVLLLLPASRPLYMDAVLPSALDRALAQAARYATGKVLVDPSQSASHAATWINLAADRLNRRLPVTTEELETVHQLAVAEESADRENAYWFQVDAAILDQLKRYPEADAAWIDASRRVSWKDYQIEFLSESLKGRPAAPAYAYGELLQLRSGQPARLIHTAAEHILRRAWNDPNRSLKIRLATVLNGELMRKWARSVSAMTEGVDLSASALMRPGQVQLHEPDPKRLHLARLDFKELVTKANLGYSADQIEMIFQQGEASEALAPLEEANANATVLSWEAAAIHVAPGALLACAVGGLLAWAIALVYRGVDRLDKFRPWLGNIAAGVAVLAVTIIVSVRVTGETNAYAAVTLGMCVLFAGATPRHVRTRRPDWLGPLFSVMTSATSLAVIVVVATLLVVFAPCGRTLIAPALQEDIQPMAMGIGLGALIAGLPFLTSPLWAFAQRLPSAYVVDKSWTQIAAKVAVISMVLAVIAGPLCAYVERRQTAELRILFLNEPEPYDRPGHSSIDDSTPPT